MTPLRRGLPIVLAVILLGADAPTPVPIPSGIPSPHFAHRLPTSTPDRVYELRGRWRCHESGREWETLAFKDEAKSTLILEHQMLAPSGHLERVRDRYRFDRTQQHWIVRSWVEDFAGTAMPWTGTTWVVTGRMDGNTGRALLRMTYHLLDASFTRTFDRFRNGRWEPFHFESCTRRT